MCSAVRISGSANVDDRDIEDDHELRDAGHGEEGVFAAAWARGLFRQVLD